MKTFQNQAAQGDFLITRISEIPAQAERINPENGLYVVAHSETGHNHVIEAAPVVTMYRLPDSIYECFVTVADGAEVDIEHKRSFDTHETLRVGPGTYRINRQREYTPEGYRRAQD